MKTILFLSTLLASSVVSAGTFYKVESLWTNTSPFNSYLPGDIVYCTKIADSDRNITGGCVNLNWMNENSVRANQDGTVNLRQFKAAKSTIVGNVKENSKEFILDEVGSAGYMSEVTMSSKIETNILVRKSLELNDSFGCSGVFDCDWRVLAKKNNVSFEVKLDGKRLEKVRLN